MSTEGRCEVTVAGPVARSAMDAIRMRFDARSRRAADSTVLMVSGVDQAAIRSLLILLWDLGHRVTAMSTSCDGPVMRDRSDQPELASGGDRLLPGGDPELAVQALVVGLDGIDRQEQCVADLPLGRRSRQGAQDR